MFHLYKLDLKTENTILGTRSYDNCAWGHSAPIFFKNISNSLGPIQKIYIMFPSKKLFTCVLENVFPKYCLFLLNDGENKPYLGKAFSKTPVDNFLDGNIK